MPKSSDNSQPTSSGRRPLNGFTIIEAVLVIAISGLLFTGVIATTNSAISNQRYNDSVNDFAEFLRNTYSEVINPQNDRTTKIGGSSASCAKTDSNAEAGRSQCALYGKLINFSDNSGNNQITIYDIIGDSQELESADGKRASNISSLSEANAILSTDNTSQYTPQWSARIDSTSDTYQPYQGAIIIYRNPSTNYVTTQVKKDNKPVDPTNVKWGDFILGTVNFCVYSDDLSLPQRRNVRLLQDGRNASAVELIDQDDTSNNACKERKTS